MRGGVFDTAFRTIPGAFVEVLDGPDVHTTAAVQPNGLVMISGSFERTTRFRASADGHESVVLTCGECYVFNQSMWINFALRPLSPPPIDLAGEYTMTVTASPSCSMLPADSRSRALPVSLTARTRQGTAAVLGYVVSYRSDAVADWLREGYIGVAGNDVNLPWWDGEGELPGLIESLGGNRYVTFLATARGTLNPGARTSMTLPLSGSIDYVEVDLPLTRFGTRVLSRQSCTSGDHRVELTAR